MGKEQEYKIIYDNSYENTVNTKVYYHGLGEHLRGFLCGKSVKEILEIDEFVSICICGGAPELHEVDGRKTGYLICCKQCGRSLYRSTCDVDINDWDELLDACIRDWKAGLCTEDIQKMNGAEHERIRIKEADYKGKTAEEVIKEQSGKRS